ncbi:MFS transporter [Thermococcus sp.]
MSLRDYRGFSRDAKLVVAYSFFGWLGGNIAWFILPFYFKAMDMDFTEIGTLFSVSTIVQSLLLLVSGQISVRIGYKKTVLLALVFYLTARAIQIFYPVFWVLIMASVVLGIATALEWPALAALLSGETTDERRHYLFTLNSALGTAGAAVGMILGGALPRLFGGSAPYRYTLMFALLFLIIQICLIAFVSPVLGREEKRLRIRRNLLLKIAKFAFPGALIGLGAGVTIPYMGLWFNLRFGTSLESIGGLFAIQQIVMAFGMFLIPLIVDRIGSVRTVVGFNGSATALIVALPFAPGFLIAALIYIVRTILMNIVNPIWDAFALRFFTKEERATSIALRSFAWTSTFGIGQYLGGIIFDYSLTAPFLITGILYGLAVVAIWILFAEHEE